MSASQQFPVTDDYLLRQTAPAQEIKLDPQFGSIRMVTPIGRLAYVTLDKPKQVKQQDGSMGPEQFSVTLLLNPSTCSDIYRAIIMVGANRFQPEQKPNPQNPGEIVTFSADSQDPSRNLFFLANGGLHYPLRQGLDAYMREPAKYDPWKSLFYINTSMLATSPRGQAQRPVCKDENGMDVAPTPDRFYSGMYGRLQITLFAYPKPGTQGRGSRGVGIGLNAVQFARHGERMGGFDAAKAAADAFAKAGAIPQDPNAPSAPATYGENRAGPGSVPPGVGFAAPPQGGYAAAPQPQYAQQPVPPQQPMVPPPGARPPGM